MIIFYWQNLRQIYTIYFIIFKNMHERSFFCHERSTFCVLRGKNGEIVISDGYGKPMLETETIPHCSFCRTAFGICFIIFLWKFYANFVLIFYEIVFCLILENPRLCHLPPSRGCFSLIRQRFFFWHSMPLRWRLRPGLRNQKEL